MVSTKSIKIGFTGDIALSSQFYCNLLNNDVDLFDGMVGAWAYCDFVVGNFEGTLIPDNPDFQYKPAKLQSPECILNAFSNTTFCTYMFRYINMARYIWRY